MGGGSDDATMSNDQEFVIPEVREAARELLLPRWRSLHSACIAEPSPSLACAIGLPASSAPPPG
jgi:hypothetical protein